MTVDRALVLFPGSLGDFICFLPTLCGLRARHRGQLRVVAKPALLELLRLPDTDSASIDRREIGDLFASGRDLAAETMTLLGGFNRVYSWTGFGDAAFARRLETATGGTVCMYRFRGTQSGEHAADYYARCVGLNLERTAAPLALVEDPEWLARFTAEHRIADQRIVVLHAGSGATRKNWQGFAAVARYWQRRFDDVLVQLRGPAEPDGSIVLRGALQADGLSLPQVVALLRRSGLYLGNDSGVSHLAGAAGACGVVLFGASDPATWAPRSERLRVVCAADGCAACAPDTFCVHRLAAEPVIRVLEAQRAVAISTSAVARPRAPGG